jgi:hypothetical protein
LDGETLCRDVYPAEVARPDGSVLKDVRAFATSHRLLVYRALDGGGVDVALDVELSEPHSIPATRNGLTGGGRVECRTADGTYWVNRGRGCGCFGPSRILRAIGPPIGWNGVRNG